jgi:hypothetical protein
MPKTKLISEMELHYVNDDFFDLPFETMFKEVRTLDKIDKFETLSENRFFVPHMCVFASYAYAMDSDKKKASSMQNGSNRRVLDIAKV